jgi:hypothetical protein
MRGLMSSVYLYAVSYDLGFAPNPFGGLCSLACCKPAIRAGAQHADWIVGLTGTKLPPALRCVFAMQVTRSMTFEDYWADAEFETRKSRRNGSAKKQVGDNIYHRDTPRDPWVQEDSVHSLEDGSQCPLNTAHDTRINRVLLSDRFVYFGAAAPPVPAAILSELNYARNPRDIRKYDMADAKSLIDWLEPQIVAHSNVPVDDPINFDASSKRFSATRQRMV